MGGHIPAGLRCADALMGRRGSFGRPTPSSARRSRRPSAPPASIRRVRRSKFFGAPVLSPDRDRPLRHHGPRLHGESWRTSVAQIPARRIASGRAADRDHEFEKQDAKLSRRAFHRRGAQTCAMYGTITEGPGAIRAGIVPRDDGQEPYEVGPPVSPLHS